MANKGHMLHTQLELGMLSVVAASRAHSARQMLLDACGHEDMTAFCTSCTGCWDIHAVLPPCGKVHSQLLNRTCPLHCGPAPMPMVGMLRASVTAAAIGAGMHSSTIAKQPLSCRALAWLMTLTASLATWA
jgi:hypothetical protein